MTVPFSDRESVYTRPDVALEPLIHGYYAWLNLVSPLTAAMHFSKLYVPLLRSFTEDSELHRASVRDPKLRGGMFVDLDDGCSDAVRQLIKELAGGAMPVLAAAVDQLTAALESTADGFDLTSRYRDIPDPLKGYVELVYDLNDHARVRYCEALLYASSYYDQRAQRIDISLSTDDHRPFAMSTPRLGGAGHLQRAMPLRDPRIDLLFSAMRVPRPFGELRAAFEVSREEAQAFALFFTSCPPRHAEQREADERLRVRYFGHACVVTEAGPVTVMTDPFLSDNRREGRYGYADLPDRIDFALVTHGHQDHLELATLLKLRHRIGTVVVPRTNSGALQDPSLSLCLKALGFDNVTAVEAGDVLEFETGRIIVCPFIGEHCDLDIGAKVTYAVRSAGQTLYFGADCRGLDRALFTNIHRMVGDIDHLFLGMECDGAPLSWIYGPLFSRQLDRKKNLSRQLNGSNAIEAIGIVRELKAKAAHVYAMGREPWLQFIMATNYTADSYQLKQVSEFFSRCAALGIPADELYGQAHIV